MAIHDYACVALGVALGSLGGAAGSMYATRVWKGKKMAGNMGNKNCTVAGLEVHMLVCTYLEVHMLVCTYLEVHVHVCTYLPGDRPSHDPCMYAHPYACACTYTSSRYIPRDWPLHVTQVE